MPTDYKLDSTTHDLDLSTQRLETFEQNTAAVAQRIKIALLTRYGEWFLDTGVGVPYNRFSSVKNTKLILDEFLQEYIRNIEDVLTLREYESVLDPSNRRISVKFVVTTTGGQVVDLELEV
jgi:hypothetical protein|tara:strand:+ start:46 stop:408 length:363 start_codon:yes stop_codon:yes gene_type:complete